MKAIWVKRKAILDKDGNPLSVHPGNGGSPSGDFHAWRMRMREKYGGMLDRISGDEFIAEKRAEAEREDAMTTTMKKQFIYDKDGNELAIASGAEGFANEDIHAWRKWVREKYGAALDEISVDEFIAEKRAEALRD